MKNAKLAARIKAVNAANRAANAGAIIIADALNDLVGTKITKNDGTLMASVKKRINLSDLERGIHQILHDRQLTSTLCWTFKACESIEGTSQCLYHDATVYAGVLENGFLVSLNDLDFYRENWTANEVVEKRTRYKELQREADVFRSELSDFGIEDRD